mmetsp:Transcript_1956/g.5819  ORF Transcript_1956/g.5819 Transcript_1956/m.5819 type:complete len:462 (-) Transcript_1956:223-1608(-)
MQRIYQGAVAAKRLRPDAAQAALVQRLDALAVRLPAYDGELRVYRKQRNEIEEERRTALRGLEKETEAFTAAELRFEEELKSLRRPRKPKGLYIHGGVGTGKTALMDMFYDNTPLEAKRRVHLHDFFLDVHQRIHAWKQRPLPVDEEDEVAVDESEGAPPPRVFHPALAAEDQRPDSPAQRILRRQRRPESDGIAAVARELAAAHTLLAFDEFVVTDVVDALIMRQLFEAMLRAGMVVVATSNTNPEDLYKGGLNYPYFAPFLDVLRRHTATFDMQSDCDYRLLSAGAQARYLTPITSETREAADEAFAALADGAAVAARDLKVAFGRTLRVKHASGRRVCRFDFEELCGDREPVMGAPDFQALCAEFDAIVVDNTPVLGEKDHNLARRFVMLIDQMYDHDVALVLSAAAPPRKLFARVAGWEDASGDAAPEDDGALLSVKEMRTAAKRAVSRIMEMTGGA